MNPVSYPFAFLSPFVPQLRRQWTGRGMEHGKESELGNWGHVNVHSMFMVIVVVMENGWGFFFLLGMVVWGVWTRVQRSVDNLVNEYRAPLFILGMG